VTSTAIGANVSSAERLGRVTLYPKQRDAAFFRLFDS